MVIKISHSYKWMKTLTPKLLQCHNRAKLICFRRYGLYTSEEIRSAFINFYEKRYQHVQVPSSKVFSTTDNSLLFVNAGMNQFKSIFLGTSLKNSKFDGIQRAVNSQRCVRVGGKHNDLEAVGKDLHHHTLFEMLGSWSFGDYFKREACAMAWELLTGVFGLPVEKLYVTYFGGCDQLGLEPDHETKEIWLSVGVPKNRILPFGSKENFWEMGEAGPCGPCTEIHYDRIGGRYAPGEVNLDNSNIIEVWNLVFMQYNRLKQNILEPLQKFHVDTGMGLERITAIMQGKVSNYDTDLFQPIISTLEKLSSSRAYHGKIGQQDTDGVDAAYRIISDHMRMLTIAVGDGLFPGSRGRELIIRHVLRRAVNAGSKKLKLERMFIRHLVPIVVDKFKSSYPDLEKRQSEIIDILSSGEDGYYNLVDAGDAVFEKTVSNMSSHESRFPTDVALHLLSHQGYPRDCFMAKLHKHNKVIDEDEVEKFFKEKHSEMFEGDLMPKDTKQKKTNFPQIIQGLFSLKLSQTEPCSSKYMERLDDGNYNFHPISAKIAAFITEDGQILQDVRNLTGDVFLVFNTTCFFHPKEHKLATVGHISFEGDCYTIENVLNVQGWLLHRISLKPHDECFAKTGDTVQVYATTDQWLPMVRAFCASALVENYLPLAVGEKTVQKVHCEHDFVKYEISGNVLPDEASTLENAVRASIQEHNSSQGLNDDKKIYDANLSDYMKHCRSFRQQDMSEFIVVKHKHQGKGRSILNFVTGPRAISSARTLTLLERKVESVHNEHADLSSPALGEVCEILSRVGALTYELNKSEISFLAKMKLKAALRTLSGRLNTLQRKISRQSKKESSKNLSDCR